MRPIEGAKVHTGRQVIQGEKDRGMSQTTNAWYTMGRECKSVAVKTVVHNVLSKMWSVGIMASMWRKLKGYCVRAQKEKRNIVFVRKGDHKVALGKDL